MSTAGAPCRSLASSAALGSVASEADDPWMGVAKDKLTCG